MIDMSHSLTCNKWIKILPCILKMAKGFHFFYQSDYWWSDFQYTFSYEIRGTMIYESFFLFEIIFEFELNSTNNQSTFSNSVSSRLFFLRNAREKNNKLYIIRTCNICNNLCSDKFNLLTNKLKRDSRFPCLEKLN